MRSGFWYKNFDAQNYVGSCEMKEKDDEVEQMATKSSSPLILVSGERLITYVVSLEDLSPPILSLEIRA